jgi:hypothetical protein
MSSEHAAAAPTPDAAAPQAPGYQYEVVLRRPTGPWGRWKGRVVMTSPTGERHYWPPRSARSRHRLITALWEEAVRDIQWRTRRGSVRLVEGR